MPKEEVAEEVEADGWWDQITPWVLMVMGVRVSKIEKKLFWKSHYMFTVPGYQGASPKETAAMILQLMLCHDPAK